MNSNSIGIKISQRRLALRLTQHQLAHASGITQAAISYLESGRRQPSISMLQLLASVLHTRVSELVEGL